MGGLRKGDRVEVRSDEVGFLGSWYEGVIIRKAAKSCTIRYKTLVGEGSQEALQESVRMELVRPVPPAVPLDGAGFEPGDAIEAYDRDGWWVGIVSKVNADGKYAVYFRESCEEMVYPMSQLRARQDWLHGIWIRVYEKRNPCLEAYRRRVQASSPVSRQQIRGFAGLKRRINTERDTPSEKPDNRQLPQDTLDDPQPDESDNLSDSDNDNEDDDADMPLNDIPSKSPSEVVEPPGQRHSPGSSSGGGRSKRKDRDEQPERQPDCSNRRGDVCRVRQVQVRAYSSVLKAFRSKGPGLTWHQEQLITDLRSQFDIDNDVHIQQLEALDGWEVSCDCSYCSCS